MPYLDERGGRTIPGKSPAIEDLLRGAMARYSGAASASMFAVAMPLLIPRSSSLSSSGLSEPERASSRVIRPALNAWLMDCWKVWVP